ncbi:unnamed protein product [Darwinula stevensoni]|uniref:Uncharacterized protein n=1 Tax=Darwinula stevensoni TaxID=69355 RepID=A0A7R9A4W7_9CRUS|nr:unnamed protein product [Darwinula stevensoni]CAG0894383.1 unnamed protein product [Darwinula stevensoni]
MVGLHRSEVESKSVDDITTLFHHHSKDSDPLPNPIAAEEVCWCSGFQGGSILDLQREIEELKGQLTQKEDAIMKMEATMLQEAQEYPQGPAAALREEVCFWEEKHERLLEAHQKLARVNQSLEDKLLKVVDKFQSEKETLLADVKRLSAQVSQAQVIMAQMQQDLERYKNDCALAVHLLQCKPSQFIPQSFSELPSEFQEKVRSMTKSKTKRQPLKTMRVPISTFPPTAVFFSIEKDEESPGNEENRDELVSAAVLARVLEEREKSGHKHCNTCKCYTHQTTTGSDASSWSSEESTQTEGTLQTVSVNANAPSRWRKHSTETEI